MNGQLRAATRLVAAIVLVWAVALPAFGAAGVASAAPGANPGPIDLKNIGASSTISFAGQDSQVSVAIPVPVGLTPRSLDGTVQLPSFVTGGSIDVSQGDRLLARTDIGDGPTPHISLPLDGLRITDRAATVVLRAYLRTDGYCRFDPDQQLRIVGTTVNFNGGESSPGSIADFLPPILQTLTVYVPQDVQPAEGIAAVDLAAAVISNYGTADVRVRTKSLPRAQLTPTDVPGPLERQVVIASTAQRGITMQPGRGAPYLVIGGDAETLVSQAQFLASNVAAIAVGSAAVAGPMRVAPQLPQDVTTLSQLGVADQMITSVAWPSLSIGIDQTRLGRPVKGIRVQLKGSYTPLPAAAGGRLVATIGNRTIDSWAGDESGAFDRWVSVPNDLLSRVVRLTVTLERGDLREGCGTGFESSLSLTAAGEVEVHGAQPPEPQGFQSLPQALMPRTALAWTDGDVADVRRAVSIAAAMQHMSVVPLGFDLVPVADAVSGDRPAVIISSRGTQLGALPLPVKSDGSVVDATLPSGKSVPITITPTLHYGSLQVTQSAGRSLLVATSSDDPATLDRLLGWLDDDPQRWSGIDGSALIQIGTTDPVLLANIDASASKSPAHTARNIAIAVGAVAVFALGAGTLYAWRRRRERS